MAAALSSVRARATDTVTTPTARHTDDAAVLRTLAPRQRRVLELFRTRAVITGPEIATYLGISPCTANLLAREWLEADFLEIEDPARRSRKYRLSPHYERLVRP